MFGQLATLAPDDFFERALAGTARVFGRPPSADAPWRTVTRFALSGSPRYEGNGAYVPYVVTNVDIDGSEHSRREELIAKRTEGGWLLWYDLELFPSLALFLHPLT